MTTFTTTSNAPKRSTSRSARAILGTAALAATLAFAAPAMAQTYGPGGYTGPGPTVVSVREAKSLRDDSPVALRGHIVQHLGGKSYVFKDDTGTVTVEIDHRAWGGVQAGANDVVELHGEVDKDWTEFEIDVKRVVKVQ